MNSYNHFIYEFICIWIHIYEFIYEMINAVDCSGLAASMQWTRRLGARQLIVIRGAARDWQMHLSPHLARAALRLLVCRQLRKHGARPPVAPSAYRRQCCSVTYRRQCQSSDRTVGAERRGIVCARLHAWTHACHTRANTAKLGGQFEGPRGFQVNSLVLCCDFIIKILIQSTDHLPRWSLPF